MPASLSRSLTERFRRARAAAAALLSCGLAAGLLATAGPAAAQDAVTTLDPAEKAAFEQLIRDYLMEHPEVIVEAIQQMREREQAAAEQRQQQALADSLAALRDDPADPVLGNLEGDVVVVEFFDYQCGYCKRVAPDLQRTVAEDGGVKLVMKEFPILGPASIVAAKAALAAERQGRYEDFHWAMMENKAPLGEETVFAVAEQVGLDLEQLRADMADPEIETQLAETYALAERLGIGGTPAFVIGEQLVPGAVPAARLRQLIEEARQG